MHDLLILLLKLAAALTALIPVAVTFAMVGRGNRVIWLVLFPILCAACVGLLLLLDQGLQDGPPALRLALLVMSGTTLGPAAILFSAQWLAIRRRHRSQ